MTRLTEHRSLPDRGPGTARTVMLHRYGERGARPKAYLQASLHADETPGLLVQHHLLRLLDEADARNAISGEVVIVPYANPIGLAQFVNAVHLGRYELGGGGNFNRNWPDLREAVARRVEGRLGPDAEANTALIRAAMGEVLAERAPTSELAALRTILAGEAADADLVLDLHCDDDALMHLYTIPALWPDLADLAGELECRAVLLSDPSGGNPFDEAFSAPWTHLAARFPDHPIPVACVSATVELRGRADVSDELAGADAAALYRVLQRRGFVAGDPGPMPIGIVEATPLEALDVVRAPAAGVLCYKAALGAEVREGETVAELVDPAAADPAAARRRIVSGTDGIVMSRRLHKYVTAGLAVARIAGTRPLPGRIGANLMDD